ALPGASERAARVCANMTALPTGGSNAALPPTILLLLGPKYRASARESFDRVAAQPHLIPGWRGRWYHHLLAYNTGRLRAAELLGRAGACRANQCEAHFYIGMHALAAGDRARARDCFARSYETGVFTYIEYMWSRAFLACVEDPNWLPWIPAHKPAPAR